MAAQSRRLNEEDKRLYEKFVKQVDWEENTPEGRAYRAKRDREIIETTQRVVDDMHAGQARSAAATRNCRYTG